MKAIFLLFFAVFVCVCGQAYGQQLIPKGKFLADTAKIGEPIAYVLVLKHPANAEVLFPDSAFNFAPFDFESKEYFTTQTDDGNISTDSAIYTFSTFETDSVQRLALPVFLLNNGDTSRYFTDLDSIIFQPTLVATASNEAKLIENTNQIALNAEFNYIYVLIGLGILVFLALLLVLLFGRQIRHFYQVRRLKRQYEKFMNDYDRQSKKQQDRNAIEKCVVLWKHFLEDMQDVPFSTYTSKELADVIPNQALNDALKNTDRAIYGSIFDTQLPEALAVLKGYAQQIYQEKLTKTRNV